MIRWLKQWLPVKVWCIWHKYEGMFVFDREVDMYNSLHDYDPSCDNHILGPKWMTRRKRDGYYDHYFGQRQEDFNDCRTE